MKIFFVAMVALWVLLGVAGAIIAANFGDQAVDIYSTIRPAVAAGAIAMAAILTTTRATWMGRLKDAYEDPDHLELVEELQARGRAVGYYDGFARLSAALGILNLLFAATAVTQFSIGFIKSSYAAGACLGCAAAAMILYCYLLFRVRKIEKSWIRKLESDQKRARFTQREAPVF